MIGGVFIEVSFGSREWFDITKAQSARWRLRKLVGPSVKVDGTEIFSDKWIRRIYDAIATAIYFATDKIFTQRRGKTYNDRSYALAASHGYAIFHNGELEISNSKNGFGHPQESRKDGVSGRERFDDFIQSYVPNFKQGWSVLFAASTPYAARLEAEYDKRVLSQMCAGFANALSERFARRVYYQTGYILENTGERFYYV